MAIKVNDYPRLYVSIITLAPGEILPGYSPGNVVGGFLVYGSAAAVVDGVEGEQSAQLGWVPTTVDGPWLDAWEDRARVRGKGYLKAGSGGAQWVCLIGKRGYMPAVTPQLVEGRFAIQAGQRFVVARGVVEYDNQQGEQGNLFAPREHDTDVTGAADILILT